MDINDIKTYDDYYAMLKAFHDGDPDGNGVNGDTCLPLLLKFCLSIVKRCRQRAVYNDVQTAVCADGHSVGYGGRI